MEKSDQAKGTVYFGKGRGKKNARFGKRNQARGRERGRRY